MRWTMVILPNTPEMVQKVAEMRSGKIGLHVEFETGGTNGQLSTVTECVASFPDTQSR